MIFRFIIALLFVANFANASSSEWVNSDNIKARINYENSVVSVEVVPDSGWHIYWKEPGDAGVPTEFGWTGSTDFKVIEIEYPKYKVFDEYGLKTNGYDAPVVFPVRASVTPDSAIKLRLTGAVCHEVCVPFDMKLNYANFAKAEVPKAIEPQHIGLGILWTAFLAGLILNIMPCVLPVLSLKVLSLVKQSGKEFAHARLNFLSTALGIISSFLLLAIGAIILKESGKTLGWGLHFQSPIFVGILFAIVLLFSISLFGLFHLRVPSWISDQGAHADSLAGNFIAGMLATLLGTACTAPILVSAVGFALSGDEFQIITIFVVMGLGMALPYFLFAAFPRLAKFLPKPGVWMVWVKNIMAVLLLITAAWLGTILYAQLVDEPVQIEKSQGLVQWQKFNEADIAKMTAQGQVVFVDITAKWCVNCQVNKARVLTTKEMEKFFADENVVLMRGDMTRPSEELLTYIRKFGRTGIPFNAVYGLGQSDPVLLSPILSTEDVKNAILGAKSK